MVRTIIGADWGKKPAKRAVFVGDVFARTVSAASGRDWTLAELLSFAGQHPPPVLIGLDLALGLPRVFAQQGEPPSFLHWLESEGAGEALRAEPVSKAEAWSHASPFFRVPPGVGGLGGFSARAGGDLRRRLDRDTLAKPLFAVSGIPGSVGSATRAMWQELRPLLHRRPFALWPFDGSLDELCRTQPTILAEMYPALAYGTALSSTLPGPQLLVSKTRAEVRRAVLTRLANAPWIHQAGVRLKDLDRARNSEDDFDAALFTIAALRCVVEGHPLSLPQHTDPLEGGMLLSATVDLGVRRRFKPDPKSPATQP